MSKIPKIVRLINLMHHRQYVTLKDIVRVCEVSKRSAYRYINTISDANIPVTFDKSVGGYRIDHLDSFSVQDLSTNDAVLILVALDTLAQRLGDTYVEEADNLIKKLLARLPPGTGEVWSSFRHEAGSSDNSRTIAEHIKSILIHISISNSRKLKVLMAGGNTTDKAVEVADPVLRFRQEWLLEGSSATGHETIPVSRIKKAIIV